MSFVSRDVVVEYVMLRRREIYTLGNLHRRDLGISPG